jgi:hypothetical protein
MEDIAFISDFPIFLFFPYHLKIRLQHRGNSHNYISHLAISTLLQQLNAGPSWLLSPNQRSLPSLPSPAISTATTINQLK